MLYLNHWVNVLFNIPQLGDTAITVRYHDMCSMLFKESSGLLDDAGRYIAGLQTVMVQIAAKVADILEDLQYLRSAGMGRLHSGPTLALRDTCEARVNMRAREFLRDYMRGFLWRTRINFHYRKKLETVSKLSVRIMFVILCSIIIHGLSIIEFSRVCYHFTDMVSILIKLSRSTVVHQISSSIMTIRWIMETVT